MKREKQPATDPSGSVRIFDALLNRMLSGKLQPGCRLDGERVLMNEFGVSRTTLREALAQLRVCGLLRVEHGKAPAAGLLDREWLARLFPLLLPAEDRSEYRHFFQLRLAVEPEAAAMAAAQGDGDGKAALKDALEGFAAAESAVERAEADYRFHSAVARCSGNVYFPLIIELLRPLFMRTITMSCQFNRERYRAADRSHAKIVSAIFHGEETPARETMRTHLEVSCRRFLR